MLSVSHSRDLAVLSTFGHSQHTQENDEDRIPPRLYLADAPSFPPRGFLLPPQTPPAPQAILTEARATASKVRVSSPGRGSRRAGGCHGAEGGRGALERPHAEGRGPGLHRLGRHLL